MESQVMLPAFVLIEGDTYNSRCLMVKWVVPLLESYRWQGQTPVKQSVWGIIKGLYFIVSSSAGSSTWNYSLADTVAAAVSHFHSLEIHQSCSDMSAERCRKHLNIKYNECVWHCGRHWQLKSNVLFAHYVNVWCLYTEKVIHEYNTETGDGW